MHELEQVIADWNEEVPVGTPVRYWRGAREGVGKVGRTRYKARQLGDHTPVVWIDNTSGCIALTHVEVISQEEYEAAVSEPIPAVPSATETPDGGLSGSQDHRTSEGLSDALLDAEIGHNVHCPCVEALAVLHWLIAAGVNVTIGATSYQGGAALKVSLDLGDEPEDDPVWKGGHLADLLASARAYCESEGITP